jgi:hypothetical protein
MVIHRILARLVTTTNMITPFLFLFIVVLSRFFVLGGICGSALCLLLDAKVGGPQIPIKARVVVGLKHQFAGARGFFLWIGRY